MTKAEKAVDEKWEAELKEMAHKWWMEFIEAMESDPDIKK